MQRDNQTENSVRITKAAFVKGLVGGDKLLYDGTPQIAFLGRSNVGKSSVINSLVDTTIAKSSARPGKTTELNVFDVHTRTKEGTERNVYLVDFPGYGYARRSAKQADKFRKRIIWYLTESGARPEKVVLIVDARRGLTNLDQELLSILEAEQYPVCIVLNKIDALTQKEEHALDISVQKTLEKYSHLKYAVIKTSTKTKKGVIMLTDIVFGS